jgi:hypothetical protein
MPDLYPGEVGFSNDILVNQGAPDTAVSIPSTQPSFDTAGTLPGTAKDILTAGSQAIIGVTQAIGAVQQARATVAANSAIASNNARLTMQQQTASAQVANLQNQTAIARAQQEFNKAAGVVGTSPGGLMVVLAVVGLVIAWAGLRARR